MTGAIKSFSACRILPNSEYNTTGHIWPYAAKLTTASKNFWNSLSEEQKALYLCFETDSNDRNSVEEDQLVRQVFLLARELYR